MKNFLKIIIVLLVLFDFSKIVADCLLIKDDKDIIIIQESDDCCLRKSPCSTFKIVISLIGFNENIIKDKIIPEWHFKKKYADTIDIWKQTHNPELWIKNSCFWYSQKIIKKIGYQMLNDYINKFNYGNKDVSADKDKTNGFNSWVSSSLKISPEEQIDFLKQLLQNKLPVNQKSHEMTRQILFIENLANSWKLYGKTGADFLFNKDNEKKINGQYGWFIGWIEKNNSYYIFVHYLEEKEIQDLQIAQRAKQYVKNRLKDLIQKHNL